MATTQSELESRLDDFENEQSVVFYRRQLLRNTEYNPTSAASKRSLGRYVRAVSNAVTIPAAAYLLSPSFASMRNKRKAGIVRGVVEPAVSAAFENTANTTRLFYNEGFVAAGRSHRAVMGAIEQERLEAITANVIERSLENENLYGARSMLRGGYNKIASSGQFSTVLSTLNAYAEESTVVAAREVRSTNPCDYCRWHDGRIIESYQIGDDINRFHDHCRCEIVLYFE